MREINFRTYDEERNKMVRIDKIDFNKWMQDYFRTELDL